MENSIIAVIMGFVEGITEFLPISSSGHMALVGELLNFKGEKAASFEIVIQLGAIMAVVTVYWSRFWGLLNFRDNRGFSGLRGIWLLILTTAPVCVAGLILHPLIKKYLFGPESIFYGLITGAICMILTDMRRYEPTCQELSGITPKIALGIGLGQCLALWPGFSRSASTIMAGLLMGCKRSVSVQYSFIAAVPVMVAATGYDLFRNFHLFTQADLPLFLIGMLTAYFSALVAIRFFIALLGRVTLIPFAIYRLALAPFIYWFLIK